MQLLPPDPHHRRVLHARKPQTTPLRALEVTSLNMLTQNEKKTGFSVMFNLMFNDFP